ncbi:hypothetical protein [Nostoc sp.]|uniref:hypothetical protein n=1 Tax=Nostoc sp. TaxID=1180 RepID=UPI002FF907FD
MLDYLTAGIAKCMTLFGVQESLLEFRLGYLGRYWFLAISASLLLGFLLSAPIIITLIIKFAVDPFTINPLIVIVKFWLASEMLISLPISLNSGIGKICYQQILPSFLRLLQSENYQPYIIRLK